MFIKKGDSPYSSTVSDLRIAGSILKRRARAPRDFFSGDSTEVRLYGYRTL